MRLRGMETGNESTFNLLVASSLCSLPDWVDLFPLHKCACEGDCGGARVCLTGGMSADERDSDSWAPLHYACW